LRWQEDDDEPRPAGAYGRIDADSEGREQATPADQPDTDKGVFKDFYHAIRNLVSRDEEGSDPSQDYIDLTDRSGLMSIHTDKELRVTALNEEVRNILGQGDEVLGKSLIGSVLPLTVETAAKLDLWRHRLSAGMDRYHSLIVETEDGDHRPIWINFSVEPTFDEDGTMDGTKWTGRDVSEGVLNSTRPCSERRIGPMIEALPLPALLLAQDGHILAWNHLWLESFVIRSDQAVITPESLLSSMLAAVTDHHRFMEKVMRPCQEAEPETVPIELWTGVRFRCSFFNLNVASSEPEVLVLLQKDDRADGEANGCHPGLNTTEQTFEMRTIMDLVHVLHSLLDLQDQGMFILNEGGEIIQWNVSMERMTGLPSQETLGVGLMELDDRIPGMAYLEVEMRRSLLGLDLLVPEEALKVKLWFNDPKELDLIVRTFPVSTSKGRMLICRCSKDISLEQGAEREAQLSCHGLVENERDMLLVTDHQGQVIYGSDKAQDLLSTDGANVLGKNIVELLPDWFKTDTSEGNALFLEDREGHHHRYALSMVRLPGPPVCYLFHGAEESSYQAEETGPGIHLAEQLLEEFDHPSLVIDDKGVVRMSNLKAKELFPVRTGEELWCRVVPDYDQDLCREMLVEARRRYKMESLDVHLNTIDGGLYQARLEVRTLLNGGGVPMAFVVHVRSLDSIGEAEPMEGMSYPDTFTEEAVGTVGTASKSCEAEPVAEARTMSMPLATPLDKHTQLVLDYAMIGQCEPGWFSLPELCRIAAEEMHSDGYDDFGEIDQVSFYADPLIVKVLPKLLENALKHAKGGENIDVKFSMGEYGGYLVVQDDGPGIPDDRKNQIFDPVEGSGMIHDLYFIRQLLSMTGLEIVENGMFGHGARIEIFIPHDCLLR
jgi:PAS domain-containing protein